MTIRIDGTNTAANPGITGADTDTGLSFGTNEVSINTDTDTFEGFDGTAWGSIGGGASAGGAIYEVSQTISADYTITAGTNGLSAGPITIDDGVTVTIPSGSTWTIV